MNRKSRLLGAAAGTWQVPRPTSPLNQLLAAQRAQEDALSALGVQVGDVVSIQQGKPPTILTGSQQPSE